MTNTLQKKWRKSTLIGLGILGLASNAQAVVTMYFEQIGINDVKVSAVGTLDFSGGLLSGASVGDSTGSSLNSVTVIGFASFSTLAAGTASTTTLVAGGSSSGGVGSTFGFSGSDVYWDAADITAGGLGSVAQLTWSADKDWFIRTGATLAAMGADSFNNTLAWKATTSGDEIRFQSGAAPVPEPSGIILSAMGGLGLLLRRCR